MNIAKIVIGANFGDEGKGLMTDYFANEAKKQNKSCLVVCHNGGSQKGHTVVSPLGIRHVFHHFGSGNFVGADTYLASEYIVNPIIFNKELSELQRKNLVTKCYVNKNCRLTTPFDMMINQIVEEYRGGNKHGSCGLGIFETIKRNDITNKIQMTNNTKMNNKTNVGYIANIGFTISEFVNTPILEMKKLLGEIADKYLPDRLKQLGVEDIPDKWIEILSNKDRIIENYICDFMAMSDNIIIVDNGIIDKYDYVVFEGAQGLLLDQNNREYMPHLTPSNTGLKNPLDIIGRREADIEVCYVSRTYMTRHGAGRFDSECNKSEINPRIVDLTNVPNPYQDSIRYGTLDLKELRERVDKDLSGKKIKKSLAVTHCNEYEIDKVELEKIFDGFGIYISDGMTNMDVVRGML